MLDEEGASGSSAFRGPVFPATRRTGHGRSAAPANWGGMGWTNDDGGMDMELSSTTIIIMNITTASVGTTGTIGADSCHEEASQSRPVRGWLGQG